MSSPQQIFVTNKMRAAADRLGKDYTIFKALQAEYTAQNWGALFTNSATPIDDGSVSDGRPVITEANMLAFFSIVTAYISFMEASANTNLNLVLKVGPNADQP